MEYRIPYDHHELTFKLPDDQEVYCLSPRAAEAPGLEFSRDEEMKRVREALESPLESPPLSRLAREARRAVIITSDHTRPLPSRLTLPLLLEAMRRENPELSLEVLVATGLHETPDSRVIREKFGDLPDRIPFYWHDARDRENLVSLGTLPSGGPLLVNRRILETDLLVSEGFIEPHFFAGYSGGRKSVLPGVAGQESIRWNHSYPMIAHPEARAGSLADNPLHRDMVAAARAAGLRFCLQVILDGSHRVIRAYGGDPFLSHEEGCREAEALFGVPVRKGRLVITSAGGYPLDQNLYQLVKAIDTASRCCEPGGTIVAAAGCRAGIGGEDFCRQLGESADPGRTLARFAALGPHNTEYDQWQTQVLLRVRARHRIVVVTGGISANTLKTMHLEGSEDLQQAVDAALTATGGPVVVIPDGIGTLITGRKDGEK